MSAIRVAWGSAAGPTATAAYDAALAEANVHDYNLVTVSSVIPPGPAVERVGTAPDLGPAGNALTVVQSRETLRPGADESAVVGVGWVRSESGRGLFYEESGADRESVVATIREGLAAGQHLREWSFDDDPTVQTATADPRPDAHACAVVVAAYGRSRPLVHPA